MRFLLWFLFSLHKSFALLIQYGFYKGKSVNQYLAPYDHFGDNGQL